MNKFSERIKELRIEKNLKQQDICDKLKFGRTTISDWENSRSEPSFDTLIVLANFFDVTVGYLLGTED